MSAKVGTLEYWQEVAEAVTDDARKLRAELAALRAELEVFREREAATAQGVRWLENESKRIERRAEKAEAELAALRAELAVLRNNQLGPVPEGPLKALGAWVADHTDDDTWPSAERYLNAALAEMEALRAERDSDGELLDWLERNPRHESAPYFDDEASAWGFPYEVSNAGGHGGGVGFRHFGSLRAAIDAAMRAEG